MVLNIAAFCIRIYLRYLTFQEFLAFFSNLKVVGVFRLHVCEILMEL